ncbi:hypothetical protein MYCTH_2126499 [Thermothelomyces thermophilus ATCC 42464]|uniref:Carboxylesterase type B domain-containing protein n=1 Tax=Thermothelomyces thermophilus (strain ATCC 42464 / BCRC 31852 / DSM 1799) TaxID=573729 RepID=G2QDI4_THET4|nr:uncharacterized protein MYCTH_2126499 [Thermothelomyces thermophilus ATCC 42464]AEO57496.1 hypothetical protein MYCTH_2126499 [Thermothelomyces thermophilus ATCC 42464]
MASWLISSLLTAASLALLVLPIDASPSPAHLRSSITFRDNSSTVPVVRVLNGSRRPCFTVSQPLNSSWEGVRNATAYPKHCIGYGGDNVGYELSEDCLYLNVLDDLHRALNSITTTAVDGVPLAHRFPPILDGDFVADYPSKQLREGASPECAR